jgi:hypothetical protein
MRSGLARTDVLLSIAAAGAMAATLVWKSTGSWRAPKDDNEVEVELLDSEKRLYNMGGLAAISTITWFRGDYQHAAGIVRAKSQQLLEANRWLTGHATISKLVYNPKKLINMEEYFQCLAPEKSPLARDTALDQLGVNSLALFVLNGPGQSLFKVSIVPCSKNPSTHFAVVVSVSHIVADGYTFYALHGMLLGGNKLESMVVERIYATRQHQIAAMGKHEYSIMSSAGFIVNNIGGVLYSKLFGVKVHSHYVLLDTEAMADAKSAITSTKEVPFCSTNDILTSWYLQNSACRHGGMAIDWRDRLAGHAKNHAGHYEHILFFQKEDSSTPGLIRQALDFFQRVVTSPHMPTFWEMATGSTAIATNWSSFAQPNMIDGCEEELHMPLYNMASILPCTTAVMCIFRAGPQGLALFLAGTETQMAGLQNSPFLSKKPITEQ